jgi:hypothetical protein
VVLILGCTAVLYTLTYLLLFFSGEGLQFEPGPVLCLTQAAMTYAVCPLYARAVLEENGRQLKPRCRATCGAMFLSITVRPAHLGRASRGLTVVLDVDGHQQTQFP